jgi:hypothetical protein
MKKVAVFLAAIAVSVSVLADPPTKEINWFGSGGYSDDTEAEENTGIRREKGAPLAPATLLLLGLGGATVGAKVVRNTRRK